MKSVFTDKKLAPTDADLRSALGKNYTCWKELADYTNKLYPTARNEWHYSGEKYGWSFRISDKRRVLIYLLPRDKFFKVAFVFGQQATEVVRASKVSETIKTALEGAKLYAEGKGIRIEVRDGHGLINDLKLLIDVKVNN